ncbi:MAG: aminotransferase class I/II-fold pyridoxal phosphate-dependent enzyme [Desulfomonilia bacterium]|nr:aminotransferase class I/II-fold pyridoxal phosphate-dependent enzyme [Desulfomonilia bacterium]
MSKPYIGNEEIEAVSEVLKSGWITTGPKSYEFESKFSSLTGAKQGLALSSGTAGMHLIFKALGISKGDEVITPSMTFASTINQIALAGAKPVFADIDYDTLLVRPEEIARLITKRTKAVIPVHFAGAPADMSAIESIAGNISIIEDAAHAIGTYYKGRHIGCRNLAVFSFHPIKNITTGEGGMITGNDEELLRRIKLLKFHGIERDAWKRYGKASDPSYDIIDPGFKYNMTDIQAVLGIVQLKRLPEINEKRAVIAKEYMNAFSALSGVDLPASPAYEHVHSWHLFIVKLRSISRQNFMEALTEHNIGYGLHFPACHTLSYVRDLCGEVRLPATEEAAERIISLPLYPGMKDYQVQRVIDVVKEIVG